MDKELMKVRNNIIMYLLNEGYSLGKIGKIMRLSRQMIFLIKEQEIDSTLDKKNVSDIIHAEQIINLKK